MAKVLLKEDEVITVNIPAGVAEGMQMTVSGKGNAARRGGINGDLIVIFSEEKHPELVRDGNDLYYSLFVSFPMLLWVHPLKSLPWKEK